MRKGLDPDPDPQIQEARKYAGPADPDTQHWNYIQQVRYGYFLNKKPIFLIYYFCAFLLGEVPPVVEGQVLLCAVHELLGPRLRSVRILHLIHNNNFILCFADPECLSRIPNPHQSTRYFRKIVDKFSEIWSGLFIPDPDPHFLLIPDPGVKKAPDLGSATLIYLAIKQDKEDKWELEVFPFLTPGSGSGIREKFVRISDSGSKPLS